MVKNHLLSCNFALSLGNCWQFLDNLGKGWEATFLIKAFCLSRELSTEVGFAFSYNGLKSQDLQFRMIFLMLFLIMFHDFGFCCEIVSTHLTYPCPKCFFDMENSITELALYNA